MIPSYRRRYAPWITINRAILITAEYLGVWSWASNDIFSSYIPKTANQLINILLYLLPCNGWFNNAIHNLKIFR